MKKIIALVLAALLLFALCACGEGSKNADESGSAAASQENAGKKDSKKKGKDGGVQKLSFKAALSYDYLKELDGTAVTINGYMATSSPVDGSFIYLMNMPYQSCPFCKPNTSELSNTMAVYPAKGKSFDYTTQAITVTGKLEVAKKDSLFTDPYGYEYSFRITDGEYKIMSSEDMTEQMKLWQKISESGLPNELNAMYEYVNFLCMWNTYFCNSTVGADGTVYPGYYLYASDAMNFLTKEGAQYAYGYRDGYFDDMIAKIRALSPTGLEDLIENVKQAQALAERALSDLENGEYTYELQYVEMFEAEDYVYTLNNGPELEAAVNELFYQYSLWLASWEM